MLLRRGLAQHGRQTRRFKNSRRPRDMHRQPRCPLDRTAVGERPFRWPPLENSIDAALNPCSRFVGCEHQPASSASSTRNSASSCNWSRMSFSSASLRRRAARSAGSPRRNWTAARVAFGLLVVLSRSLHVLLELARDPPGWYRRFRLDQLTRRSARRNRRRTFRRFATSPETRGQAPRRLSQARARCLFGLVQPWSSSLTRLKLTYRYRRTFPRCRC